MPPPIPSAFIVIAQGILNKAWLPLIDAPTPHYGKDRTFQAYALVPHCDCRDTRFMVSSGRGAARRSASEAPQNLGLRGVSSTE